ncbi:5706_t:CDS:2 [Funneliformis caledonium]|uniref:5706_t:CDS:1 n=1 Tax=Funneliformis caledonium TaxID=1117310 RepID=A0A9N9ADP2_9GLOM|nr:5706_t:CDS:2 [Funneliformis caledonium]
MNSLLTVKSNVEEPVTSDGKVNSPDATNGSVNKPDTFNGNSTVPDSFKVVRDNENMVSLLFVENKSFFVDSWEFVCKIEELSVVPLPKENPIRDELVTRGRKFAKYAIGSHYLHYNSNLFRVTFWGYVLFKAEGRVMIDTVSFTKTKPSYNKDTVKSVVNNAHNNQNNLCGEKMESNIRRTFRRCKIDDDVFNQLVMDPIKKELIVSLVTSKYKGVDLISGKVGKTLTAEAISEFLQRPLYAVSVGELGTNIVYLEAKLSEILEMASVWNAVILIDEADIFLERRSEDDIKRNALVRIFLRLLEYHQGILYLTTSRVNCFDTAFISRISVALKYNELDADAREQLCSTFWDRIEGKGKTQVNIDYLKGRPLNGREIKTAVRLAKALSTKDNPDALITTQHWKQLSIFQNLLLRRSLFSKLIKKKYLMSLFIL